MLARKRSLSLAGTTITTPRLVPSFTSKGFGYYTDNRRRLSETNHALNRVAPFIYSSILLSAFDLANRFFDSPAAACRNKELVFIDSGGYELIPDFDSTEPRVLPIYDKRTVEKFTKEAYESELRRLPRDVPFAFSNYDWGTRKKSLAVQIRDAKSLFARHLKPNRVTDFIIKPPMGAKTLTISHIAPHVSDLGEFDIIGVTDKNLGNNILDRIITLAKLRHALDKESVNAPIHVWGGLDPVVAPLYYLAGAEIFDGVSWLRYAFRDGVAIYRDAYHVLKIGIDQSNEYARYGTLLDNAQYLSAMTNELRQLISSGTVNFKAISHNRDAIQRAFRIMQDREPGLFGGA